MLSESKRRISCSPGIRRTCQNSYLPLKTFNRPLLHRPPTVYFASKAFDNPLIRIGKIGSLVGVRFQIEQEWSRFVGRIFHLTRPTVITEEQLPLIFDHPSIKQGGFGVMDVRDIVGKGLPEKRISSDLLSALQSRQQIEPRQIARSGRIRSCQYCRYDVYAAAKFRAIRGSDFSRPREDDRRSRSGLVGTAFGMGSAPSPSFLSYHRALYHVGRRDWHVRLVY